MLCSPPICFSLLPPWLVSLLPHSPSPAFMLHIFHCPLLFPLHAPYRLPLNLFLLSPSLKAYLRTLSHTHTPHMYVHVWPFDKSRRILLSDFHSRIRLRATQPSSNSKTKGKSIGESIWNLEFSSCFTLSLEDPWSADSNAPADTSLTMVLALLQIN